MYWHTGITKSAKLCSMMNNNMGCIDTIMNGHGCTDGAWWTITWDVLTQIDMRGWMVISRMMNNNMGCIDTLPDCAFTESLNNMRCFFKEKITT